jgi:TonB family protein
VPVYPNGGMPGFYQFINKNLEYPEEAKEQNIQGKVFVHFVVNDEGEIINEMAVKGINDQLDAEAVRIMKLSENSRSGLKSYIFTCH